MSGTTPMSVRGPSLELGSFGSLVPVARPRLSWLTEGDASDWTQERAILEFVSGDVATVHTVEGPHSALVDWPFDPLVPGQIGTIRVTVVGSDGQSVAGDARDVRAGFLAQGQWTAAWISHPTPRMRACPVVLRKTFGAREVVRATLYATAHGVYQVALNGVPVDDEVLKPGWTAYGKRDTYACTDVTALMRDGDNELSVDLAGGWFSELYGFNGKEFTVYGEQPSFSGLLHLEYADGTEEIIASDDSWQATDAGPITAASIYLGENYDARRAMAALAAAAWTSVKATPVDVAPVARTSPPVRVLHEVSAVEVLRSPSGALILDFGQNLVGFLRITVRGEAGHVVTLRHAEVLEGGELSTRPLRRAKATDTYALAGTGAETWHPEFTFHGFRYAEIGNWPGEFAVEDVVALVIHSDMQPTGTFESSHSLVNRLHENVMWSTRANFLSIPTDCPQRDERMGWTGDIQVFAPTAAFLYDCDAFLSSWLEDLAIEQAASGSVPIVVPDVLGSADMGAAAWGDAAVLVPWAMWERLGDRSVLERQFASMTGWVDFVARRAGADFIWAGDFQFGDWLDPSAPPDRPQAAKADRDLVATAYFYRSARTLARAADVLGRTEDARRYDDLATQVRAAWRRAFVTPAGRIMSDAQTAYALALEFGLADGADERAAMGNRLAQLVELGGNRIGTGFVGTPLIQDALTSTGHLDVAARLLVQTQCPSWLYPVTLGATTIWERWDSMLADGSVNPGEMTSFNHYALGAIADWLHRTVAGLAPAAPGYASIRIAPQPIDQLTWARAAHTSRFGVHEVAWNRDGDALTVTATVPPNTTAVVRLPDGAAEFTVGSGQHAWTVTLPPLDANAQPVTIESPLVDVLRNPRAYAAAEHALGTISPEFAAGFLANVEWTQTATFAALGIMMPPGALEAVAAEFASLA